ncbi:MAG: peptidoglycan DD-metalloendopeptidase family protein [Thermofilaceae archaeon]
MERTWANAVSADGRVVVGACLTGSYAWRAYRWTPETGLQDLGTLGIDWVDAIDVSADGNVVVGYSYAPGDYYWWAVYGFRWTPAMGMVSLGTLPGYRFTHAIAVSADGTVIVGEANQDAAPYWNRTQAWRWTASRGLEGLGSLASWYSSARGVSADGTTVIGILHNGVWENPSAFPYRAFRWRADIGMQDLGTLGGERTWVFHAVSRDGSMVFGGSQNANGEWRALRWTAQRGIEDINTLYASIIPAGWVLRSVNDCSSDGRYLVGLAEGPGGVIRGFLLDTGAPGNRPPAVPTLIAPANRAIVSPRPTFQLQASDPDGDRVRFEVELRQGNTVRTFYVPASGFVNSGQTASGTPPEDLPAGDWQWRARTWDLRGAFSGWSETRTFRAVAGGTTGPGSTSPGSIDCLPSDAQCQFLRSLIAPWRAGQYWRPSTYANHGGQDDTYGLKAVDFNRVEQPSEECPYATRSLDDCNEVVVASHAGRAYTRAQSDCVGYGNYIVLVSNVRVSGTSNTYLATIYAHLNYFLVDNGTNVAGGQPIARVGSTGTSSGPHLHYEICKVTVSGSTLTLGTRWQVLNNPAVRLSGQELRVDLGCTVSGLGYVGPPILGTASVGSVPPNQTPPCTPYNCGGFLWSPETEPGRCFETDELPIVIYLSDVNGDGCVDESDLLRVLEAIEEGIFDSASDVNWDSVVDESDLIAVLLDWGNCSF